MDQSLDQIVSLILNDVYAGLKGMQNFPISPQQIKDKFSQNRNRVIREMVLANQFTREGFMQPIKKLALVKKDFGSPSTTGRMEYFAEIPEILQIHGVDPIGYITAMDKAYPFKVVYGQDFMYTKYDQYSAKAPTIWIEDKSLWLMNPPIPNIQYISFRGILANPRAINGISGQKFMDSDPYPCPADVVAQICSAMVWDYIKQYRTGSLQPTLMAGDINLNTSSSQQQPNK